MNFGYDVVKIETTQRPFATLKAAKDIFRTWEGGLTMYGGAVPATIAGMWFLRRWGIDAWKAADAIAPWLSRPCIGFAPGAKGSPFFRPSGVDPVFLP